MLRTMTERVLPTGTVTFLFSDMEASTRLVQEIGPAAFTRALDLHNATLRGSFARHEGIERGTQGDSFLAMFRDAPSAVAAASEAQEALAATDWPAGASIQVRMGLHTGVGALGGDDYVGVDVNRAARIASLAHGGQVILSDATRALVEDALPAGATLRRLGEHRLKDFARPERLHQLVVPGLRAEFPALRQASETLGNLPARLTSFVGREFELAELRTLLAGARLLTLTGPGGTGKTRLAIELAHDRAGRFEDGAWLVGLASIVEPELVPAAIASALSIVEQRGVSATDQLTTFLADRSILLVLDNFEQVLGAATQVGDLLLAAPGLHVVVTSRAALGLSMEQEYPVAPLAVPSTGGDPANARATDSVRLFVERARRVLPAYELTADDVPAVATICRRLDGLPLGIELAAARVGLLPPRVLAERLASRLELPGRSARDLPERQQTLRTAIAWSHELLDPPARRLLARLSVFTGGFRLEEAEAVGGTADELGAEVIDALSLLVGHSLVQPTTGPDVPRFRLLETIRMFAAEQLAESGEADTIRQRHAWAYLALAEDAAEQMPGRDQVPWLDRLSADHDNLRGAIVWAVAAGHAELAHRLATASWRFWQFRGHIAEGRQRLAAVLAMPGADAPSTWRMRAVEAAGGLEWWAGRVAEADAAYTTQVELARELGDPHGIGDALFNLAHTRVLLAADPGELEVYATEATACYRRAGDERALARVAWTGGYPLLLSGRIAEAETLIRDSLRRFQTLEDDFYIALSYGAMGDLSLVQGRIGEAFRWGLKAVYAQRALDDIASITLALESAAIMLVAAGLPREGAVAKGAFEASCSRHGVRPPLDPATWMTYLGISAEQVAAELASDAYAEERERGAAMSLDEVLEFLDRTAREQLERGISSADAGG